MKVAECYRVMRHKDHAMPIIIPRPVLGRGFVLDIRIWCWSPGLGPTLLVNASKKFGRAVQRNRFRRQVRMAFLHLLRERPLTNGAQCVVWIRPARGTTSMNNLSFQEIEDQIRLALSCWEV
jgi:ribonuclease P protein component